MFGGSNLRQHTPRGLRNAHSNTTHFSSFRSGGGCWRWPDDYRRSVFHLICTVLVPKCVYTLCRHGGMPAAVEVTLCWPYEFLLRPIDYLERKSGPALRNITWFIDLSHSAHHVRPTANVWFTQILSKSRRIGLRSKSVINTPSEQIPLDINRCNMCPWLIMTVVTKYTNLMKSSGFYGPRYRAPMYDPSQHSSV
jgi:hypothetical protein